MTRQRTDLAAYLACCSILMLLLAVSMNLRAEEEKVVRDAAAADVKFAMEELSKEVGNKTATKVDVTTGSSGKFFAQIQGGAPFDLFYSAGVHYPKKMQGVGSADAG